MQNPLRVSLRSDFSAKLDVKMREDKNIFLTICNEGEGEWAQQSIRRKNGARESAVSDELPNYITC